MKDDLDFSSAKRGAVVPLPPNQTEVRLRLDDDILDWLRERVNESGGSSYQDLLNSVLRAHIHTQQEPLNKEPLEMTLRRVVRERPQNVH